MKLNVKYLKNGEYTMQVDCLKCDQPSDVTTPYISVIKDALAKKRKGTFTHDFWCDGCYKKLFLASQMSDSVKQMSEVKTEPEPELEVKPEVKQMLELKPEPADQLEPKEDVYTRVMEYEWIWAGYDAWDDPSWHKVPKKTMLIRGIYTNDKVAFKNATTWKKKYPCQGYEYFIAN